MHLSQFRPFRRRTNLTTGEVIRMLRDLKGWTQEELARRSGVNAKNISLLENGRIEIGKRRGLQLARAFDVHPSIIVFPEYETEYPRRAV